MLGAWGVGSLMDLLVTNPAYFLVRAPDVSSSPHEAKRELSAPPSGNNMGAIVVENLLLHIPVRITPLPCSKPHRTQWGLLLGRHAKDYAVKLYIEPYKQEGEQFQSQSYIVHRFKIYS